MKVLLALLLAASCILGLASMASSGSEPCTKNGGPGRDELYGTPERDVICAHAGPDYLNGRDGPDDLKAGYGNDTIVGGHGVDLLIGRPGDDDMYAVDGQPGDWIDPGEGKDRCYGDLGDHFSAACEHKVKI